MASIRRACFMDMQKKMVLPGRTPFGSLMDSSMNSFTISAFVAWFVTVLFQIAALEVDVLDFFAFKDETASDLRD